MGTTARSAAKPGQILALSGARAFPPLLLVLYHFCEGHGYRGLHWFDVIVTHGYLWVEFFFALSGFVLTLAYAPRAREFLKPRFYGKFLRDRLIRLYPLHLFLLLSLIVTVVVVRGVAHAGGYLSYFDAAGHPMVNAKSILPNLLLIQAWNTLPYLSWNGVAWFVSVEFALCIMFPAYLWLAGESVWRGFALVLAGLGGLGLLILNSTHGLDITFHDGVLRGMGDFAVGVGMANIFRAMKARPAASVHLHSVVQVALVFLLFYVMLHTGWSHTRRDYWTVPPMFALIFALAFDRGLVAEALKTRVPQVLGSWSYAVYMGQTNWLQLIHIFEDRLYPPPATIVFGMRFDAFMWWTEPALLVLVCLAWGAFLATFIEHPASGALRRFLDNWGTTARLTAA